MTKVLVTGANGYVGSYLIKLLLRNTDYEIVALDNLLSGARVIHDVFLLHDDIRDEFRMQQLIPNFDIVVHLAAIVGVPACSIDEQFAFDVNVIGTQNIVRNLRPGARIIFTSSTSSYGNKVNELVTEETTLTPLTNYGLHKLYNENEIIRHTNDYIIVRPATAFGMSRRTRLDVLPNTLIYDALTQSVIRVFEPEVIRPFIHVHDFARILLYAVTDNMQWTTIYNIGDPSMTMQKGELAQRIVDLAGNTLEIVSGKDPDQRNYQISFDRLLGTGFKFGDDMLSRAFHQIQAQLPIIREHYTSYNTPYQVREFIRDYGNRY